MYQLPKLQTQHQLPNYQKIIQHFHKKLPKNFILTTNIIFGQCLVQLSSKSSFLQSQVYAEQLILNPKRIRAKYITNKQQILLMLIKQDGVNIKITKSNIVRINFKDILQVKLSVWYCAIMLVYGQYDGELDDGYTKKLRSVIIQDIDIGSNTNEFLRQHITKYANKQSSNNIGIGTYYVCTLLDYQLFNRPSQQSMNSTSNRNTNNPNIKSNKFMAQSQLKKTKNINIRKQIQEISKQLGTFNNLKLSKNYKQYTNLSNIYTMYVQLCKEKMFSNFSNKYNSRSKINGNDRGFRMFIGVDQPNKKYVEKEKINLCRVKVITREYLANNEQCMKEIYNQCQYGKNYQIITPYIPVLSRVFGCQDMFVMQYNYYQGLTIRQLLKKDKLSIDKKYLRDFLAELVVAVGHIHQCGFVCRNIGLDSIIINHDGHVFFQDIGIMFKSSDGPKNKGKFVSQQILKDTQQESDNKKNKSRYLTSPTTKQLKNMSPEQIINNCQNSYISDWWQLGLLIHQILTGSHIFQSKTQQQIHSQLTDSKQQLNLSSLKQIVQKYKIPNSIIILCQSLLIKDKNNRLGYINDYHNILDTMYFRGIDKKKIMKRQGQGLVKIRKSQIQKEIKSLDFRKQNQDKSEMKENKINFQEFLNQCVFDRDYQFSN